jgi:hypothetical protein
MRPTSAFALGPGGGSDRADEQVVERTRAFRTLLQELSLKPVQPALGVAGALDMTTECVASPGRALALQACSLTRVCVYVFVGTAAGKGGYWGGPGQGADDDRAGSTVCASDGRGELGDHAASARAAAVVCVYLAPLPEAGPSPSAASLHMVCRAVASHPRGYRHWRGC